MPTIDMPHTGANIRALRDAHNMTVYDVAKVCGISKTAVCKWQAGTSVPSIDNLIILSYVFETPIDEIVARA